MNVVLIGMPGCGKTTLCALLSSALGYAAADTDDYVTQKYGPIPEIFSSLGEQAFRKMESEAVEELSKKDGLVIATGGGCVLNPQNVSAFKRSGKIVYLKTGLKELARRLSGDSSRPLLKGDLSARLNALYGQRGAIYEAAADAVIECDGLTPEAVRDKITEILK